MNNKPPQNKNIFCFYAHAFCQSKIWTGPSEIGLLLLQYVWGLSLGDTDDCGLQSTEGIFTHMGGLHGWAQLELPTAVTTQALPSQHESFKVVRLHSLWLRGQTESVQANKIMTFYSIQLNPKQWMLNNVKSFLQYTHLLWSQFLCSRDIPELVVSMGKVSMPEVMAVKSSSTLWWC